MNKVIVRPSDIEVGDKYYYQGANTMEKGQLYEAEVVGIYQHHIVMEIKPVVNPLTLHFTDITAYRWSISKNNIGRTENLYRRDCA